MNRWRTIVACGALVVAAVGVDGAARAATDNGGTHAARPASAVQHAALGDATTESKLTPISPCRIVDTRLKGGPIGAGKTRPYTVRGAGAAFAKQGGKADGCGIPSAATAVQVTITAVGAIGTGYLRAYPGSIAPNATFLNFKSGFNISNGGLVALAPPCTRGICGDDMRVSIHGRSTHVVIDVQGYYVKPMFAFVTYDGSLLKDTYSRVVGVKHNSAGEYTVQFDRDVFHCAISATAEPNLIAHGIPWGGAFAKVHITGPDGTEKQAGFYITVTC